MFYKRVFGVLYVLAASAILASCAGTATTISPSPFVVTEIKHSSDFVGAVNADIVTLDPHKGITFSDARINPLMWEGLVAIGSDGEWKGILAKSWDISPDGLNWVFHLREGVIFHNGRELTADDVIYSVNRILDEKTGAAMQSVLSDKILDYKAIDPHTVEFVLSNGGNTFLSEIGLGVRVAIIAKECVNDDGTITQPIGTGPFVFVSWKPGEEINASRFDGYWGHLASIDNIKFIPIADNTARFTALQTGEVDWISDIPFDKVSEVVDNPPNDVTISLVYQSNTLRLNFNSTRPPFNDGRVRQAVAYALNKSEINEAIFFGTGNVHNQPFTPGSFLYLDVKDIYAEPNLDLAKELLNQAGYSNGMEVSVIHPAGWLPGFWEVIGSQLQPLNIKLSVEMLDEAQGINRTVNLDYDMMVDQQSNIFSWERTFGYFDKSSGLNFLVGGYSSDKVTKLLEQGRSEIDPNKAKADYTQILRALQDDAAAYFILALPDVQAWQPWVKAYQPNPVNAIPLVWPDGGLNYTTLEGKTYSK